MEEWQETGMYASDINMLGKHFGRVSLSDLSSYAKACVNKTVALGRSVTAVTGLAVVGATKIIDTINPVSLGIRHGPPVVSVPLQYMSDEARGLTDHIMNPRKSATNILEYFAKKPIRVARVMQAMGVPVDSTTMAILKADNDLQKAERLISVKNPSVLAGKVTTANVERLRGKIVLSFVKALVDGGEELTEDMMKFFPQLIAHSGERVLFKTMAKALH